MLDVALRETQFGLGRERFHVIKEDNSTDIFYYSCHINKITNYAFHWSCHTQTKSTEINIILVVDLHFNIIRVADAIKNNCKILSLFSE